MKRKLGALRVAALCLGLTMVVGTGLAADHPYTEGPVITVTSIRTEPGMRDAYVKYLSTTWKQSMEAQKAAGIITEYAVYDNQFGPADRPDIYLVSVYKNMAAFDGLEARTDEVMEKLVGDQDKQNAAFIERGKMRKVLGVERMRQLVLK